MFFIPSTPILLSLSLPLDVHLRIDDFRSIVDCFVVVSPSDALCRGVLLVRGSGGQLYQSLRALFLHLLAGPPRQFVVLHSDPLLVRVVVVRCSGHFVLCSAECSLLLRLPSLGFVHVGVLRFSRCSDVRCCFSDCSLSLLRVVFPPQRSFRWREPVESKQQFSGLEKPELKDNITIETRYHGNTNVLSLILIVIICICCSQ